MQRKSGLTGAILAALTVTAAVGLAGCGTSGHATQATATPANLTMTTSAATAALPPADGAGPNAASTGTGAPGTGPRAPAPAAPPQPQFAQVVAVQPITQTSTTSNPHRVCGDQQVAVPETYRDNHQIGGAVVGGLVGALVGHQIGDGRGNTLATLAGAAGGAFAGHEIQKRHQQDNRTQMETRYVCHTYRDRSSRTTTVGYDVTYTFHGQVGHVQMDHNPGVGMGLPVENGVVVAGLHQQAGSYYR